MHIAFWSPAWPLEKYQNGIVTYVHWMKRELEGRGHRVSVFTDVLDPESTEPHVYKVRFELWDRLRRRLTRRRLDTGSDTFNFSSVIARGILRVHRRDPIDVLEMEESFGWFADIGRRTSLPMLIKLHGPAFLSLVEDEINTPFGKVKVEREGHALKTGKRDYLPRHIDFGVYDPEIRLDSSGEGACRQSVSHGQRNSVVAVGGLRKKHDTFRGEI